MGAPTAVAVALSGSDEALRATGVWFCGFTLRETGGTNGATVRIFDHASAASGTLLATVSLAAGQSSFEFHAGMYAGNGIYIDTGGTGTVEGSVFLG